MEVYVIRHTKVATEHEYCYGQSNVPLAETFGQEAEAYAKQLTDKFDAVYSSPLERCQLLANTLHPNNVILHDSLMEMNFGEWEGQKWNDIDQTQLNDWMQDFVKVKAPNGENLEVMYERVRGFLDELSGQSHQRVLLVTHAGVVRCIWAYLLEIPLQNVFKIPVNYGEVFVFKLSADHCFNSIKRLH